MDTGTLAFSPTREPGHAESVSRQPTGNSVHGPDPRSSGESRDRVAATRFEPRREVMREVRNSHRIGVLLQLRGGQMSDFTQRTKSKSQYRPQTRCVRTDLQCPWLDDVRNSSRALKSLISRASSEIPMVRKVGARTPISDPRGRVIESVGKVQTSVTPEVVVRMVGLYGAGLSARQVGLEVGLHREAVMRHLRNSGARIRRQGLDADAVDQARELYLSGKTLAQVGIVLGVAPGTIGRYLRSHGVPLRPPLIPTEVSVVQGQQ